MRDIRHLFEHGSTVGLDDGQVLARYSTRGDSAAFEAIVERHGPMVLATARAILRRESDVEDVFQATFLVLARKAGSVRGGDALGGWLHRVAYRAAVQASKADRKRRKKEAEASAMAASDRPATSPPIDPDVRAILHEEIDRLPESGRLPVILCDLEGCTYEEAARRLRWTVSIVRGRLAAARQKLRIRLTRRGVTPVILGMIFAPGAVEARAIVPEAMLRSTVSAATGGSATAGALMLSRTLLKGMLMAKILSVVTTLLAALAVGSAGVMAVGRMGTVPEPSAPPPPIVVQAPIPKPVAALVPPAVAPDPAPAEPGESVEVKGRVVGPDGAPVAGAKVVPTWPDIVNKPTPEAKSDVDGRFLIRLARPASLQNAVDRDLYMGVAAFAPGFGAGAVEGVSKVAGEVTIRLVEEGLPIEGRAVDLEGRPVAGLNVGVGLVSFPKVGDLGDWLARAENWGVSFQQKQLSYFQVNIATKTDAEGRFRLAGIGRDRIASVSFRGPTVQTETVSAMTRSGPDVRLEEGGMGGYKSTVVYHAARFEQVVSPCMPIRGVVRDKDTGRPIEGLRIGAEVVPQSGYNPSVMRLEPTTTDAEGRYTLTGLPRADAYRLTLGRSLMFDRGPGRRPPYPTAVLVAKAESPGVEPVTFDVAMKRGAVVRGRVTDRSTGLPIVGQVFAYAFPDNPAVEQYPGYRQGTVPQVTLDADGRYEIAVPPGRAVIVCRADRASYRSAIPPGSLSEFRNDRKGLGTIPQTLGLSGCHALADVTLDLKAESATVDLQVDSGRSVELTVYGMQGRPIGGTRVVGITDDPTQPPVAQESPTIEVKSLVAGKPRRVTAVHEGQMLAGSFYLKGHEDGSFDLPLRPWGEVVGRVVDAEGKPRKGVRIDHATGPGSPNPEAIGRLPDGTMVGDDGRFRIVGLVPTLKYAASASVGGGAAGLLFHDVTLNPGEVRDLGDLKSEPVPPTPEMEKKATVNAGASKVGEIKGRVVGPDGRPVAGARIVPSFYESSIKPSPEATSGADGRFSIAMPKSDRVAGRLDTSQYPWLVASAKGFGPGHVEGVQREGIGEVTIRLVEDGMPVEGRIVDLEGRPVAGAKVKVERAYFAKDGDLAPWLAQLPNRGMIQWTWSGLSSMPVAIEVKTGPDGRFRLEGVGRDRVAEMVVSGPSIANQEVHAMTRAGAEMSIESGFMGHKGTVVLHPHRFDHAAAPSKPIRGVIRDKDSGRPIAGMPIEGGVYDGFNLIPARDVDAVTDAEGRYTLDGLPKAEAYRIFVGQGRERFLPYPNATFKAPADTPGLEPVTFDIDLKRGAVVRGRVTDKVTGKPVAGWVSVFTFADNPAAAEFPGYQQSSIQQAFLDADGRYEVAAPPGRSLVACRSDMARYRGITGADAIPGYDRAGRLFKTVPQWLGLANYHALAAADLDPKAEATTVDLQVDPGRVVEMTSLDPEGRPIGGTKVEGTSDLFRNIPITQDSPTFEVRSLSPGQARRVTVRHEDRRLVGSIYLRGDEAGPITLKLEPWGEVSGRIVDDEGKPLKGYGLGHATGHPPGPLDQIGVLPGSTIGSGAKVGNDGRFRVVGLVPGLKYGASALEGGEITVGLLFHDVTVKSGEARDLGDLKIVPLSKE